MHYRFKRLVTPEQLVLLLQPRDLVLELVRVGLLPGARPRRRLPVLDHPPLTPLAPAACSDSASTPLVVISTSSSGVIIGGGGEGDEDVVQVGGGRHELGVVSGAGVGSSSSSAAEVGELQRGAEGERRGRRRPVEAAASRGAEVVVLLQAGDRGGGQGRHVLPDHRLLHPCPARPDRSPLVFSWIKLTLDRS